MASYYKDHIGYDPPMPELPEEEYVEVGPQLCDECGEEMELLYEGMVICEVCGKHFPERR